MSKLIIALAVLSACIAVQARGWEGCSQDKCDGRRTGRRYQSLCAPVSVYYRCRHSRPVYDNCRERNYCVVNGRCCRCGDTCEGKCDGVYPSVNRPRPAYYQCDGGELYYRTCQPFQIFNPWTKQCECYEGSCLHGNGYRASFCRGKEWRVYCRAGFPQFYERCPRPRPYVCCKTYTCISTCSVFQGRNGCCHA
ncbi:hypothetical protein NP493_1160g00043 [Ridgeia piscesae]|uniref:Chitin-binding type-2 domain-containing protein n=1 Tax=Ridgeia piscesae TaxID=27915 RepID=A0AAD9KG79_RIDPI|nr:hypothetical protein NP493_1160g00043 [Ridgeia piscesae]